MPLLLQTGVIILDLIWRKSTHFQRRWAENDFHIFIPSDLDLWPIYLKSAPQLLNVQHYICTKLEVSTALQLWESRRHWTDGRTDRQTDRWDAML